MGLKFERAQLVNDLPTNFFAMCRIRTGIRLPFVFIRLSYSILYAVYSLASSHFICLDIYIIKCVM